MFCKHKWEVIVDTKEDSPIERMFRLTGSLKLGSFSNDMTQATRIIILQCTKCGKLDKTVKKV